MLLVCFNCLWVPSRTGTVPYSNVFPSFLMSQKPPERKSCDSIFYDDKIVKLLSIPVPYRTVPYSSTGMCNWNAVFYGCTYVRMWRTYSDEKYTSTRILYKVRWRCMRSYVKISKKHDEGCGSATRSLFENTTWFLLFTILCKHVFIVDLMHHSDSVDSDASLSCSATASAALRALFRCKVRWLVESLFPLLFFCLSSFSFAFVNQKLLPWHWDGVWSAACSGNANALKEVSKWIIIIECLGNG